MLRSTHLVESARLDERPATRRRIVLAELDARAMPRVVVSRDGASNAGVSPMSPPQLGTERIHRRPATKLVFEALGTALVFVGFFAAAVVL